MAALHPWTIAAASPRRQAAAIPFWTTASDWRLSPAASPRCIVFQSPSVQVAPGSCRRRANGRRRAGKREPEGQKNSGPELPLPDTFVARWVHARISDGRASVGSLRLARPSYLVRLDLSATSALGRVFHPPHLSPNLSPPRGVMAGTMMAQGIAPNASRAAAHAASRDHAGRSGGRHRDRPSRGGLRHAGARARDEHQRRAPPRRPWPVDVGVCLVEGPLFRRDEQTCILEELKVFKGLWPSSTRFCLPGLRGSVYTRYSLNKRRFLNTTPFPPVPSQLPVKRGGPRSSSALAYKTYDHGTRRRYMRSVMI